MVDAITDLSGLGLLSLKDIGSNPVLTTRADWSQQESVPRRRSELTITGEGVVAQW